MYLLAETDLLEYVRDWTATAGITDGLVIRKVTPHDKVVNAPINTDLVNSRYNVYGFAFNPHDLRRSAAREWYEATGDIVLVAQMLGHGDIKTTLAYLGLLAPNMPQPTAGGAIPR